MSAEIRRVYPQWDYNGKEMQALTSAARRESHSVDFMGSQAPRNLKAKSLK